VKEVAWVRHRQIHCAVLQLVLVRATHWMDHGCDALVMLVETSRLGEAIWHWAD